MGNISRMATYYVSHNASGFGDGTYANPYTRTQADFAANDGDTIYLLPGTYTGAFIFTQGGIRWVGMASQGVEATYPTAIFDAQDGFTQPFSTNVERVQFQNITFKSSAGTSGLVLVSGSAHHSEFTRCRFTAAGGQALLHTTADALTLIGCEIDNWGRNTVTHGASLTTCIGPVFRGCYIHDGNGTGIRLNSSISNGDISNNIIDTPGGAAISNGTTLNRRVLSLRNNTIYNATDGYSFDSAALQPVLSTGNYFHTLSGTPFAYSGSAAPEVTSISDKFYSCGGTFASNLRVNQPFADSGPDLTSGGSLTDPANGDFTIKVVNGIRDAAEPKYYLSAGVLTSWRGYSDISAVDSGLDVKRGRRGPVTHYA